MKNILLRPIVVAAVILSFCVVRPMLLSAEEVNENLNVWLEPVVQKNDNPYCSTNYTFGLYLRWSAPPDGNVCYYMPYRNGAGMGYATRETSYFVWGLSGCFSSEEVFLSRVREVMDQYYYNNTYRVVASRACYGLPDIVDERTFADKETLEEASHPPLMKQIEERLKTTVGEPINVADGSMTMSEADIFIPAPEIPLAVSRFYNSQDSVEGQFGYGWRSEYDIGLTVYPDFSVVEADENGAYTRYDLNLASGTYTPSAGKYSRLTKNVDSTFTLTRKHGKKLSFDLQGRLTRIEGRNGKGVAIIRGHDGRITEVADGAGRKLTFANNEQGKVAQITDPAGRIWKYDYDTSGNLIRVTDPLNSVTTYQYDSGHRLVQKTDANGHELYFEYDVSGRAYHSWQDGNNNEVALTFDPVLSKTTVTDSKGGATQYEYNPYGLVTKLTDAQGHAQLTSWDENLNMISSTDKNSHTTSFSYDSRGNLLSQTDPLNHTTSFSYDPGYDFVATVTDALGNVTANEYDAKGNLIKITDPLGRVTVNAYDATGQLTSSTNPRSFITSFAYDAYGNLQAVTDALGHATMFVCDILGNRTLVRDAADNSTEFVYDGLSRLTRIRYSDGSMNSFTYDALGNKTSVTDNASNATTYSYDLNGQVTRITDPLGKSVELSYDTEGNKTRVVDQNLRETAFSYDSLNRLVSERNPLGLAKTFSYDAAGNRTAATDAKGVTIGYEYDALNRLTKISYPDSSASFAYDPLGRRISMSDSYGTTTYAYDPLGNLTHVQGPGPDDVLQYTYDEAGNRTGMVAPEGIAIQYSYDALNRLSSIADAEGRTTTYNYDDVGNLAGISYPNGIKAVHTYDGLHRLTALVNQNQNTLQKLSEFAYTYDQAGRRSGVALLDGVIDYSYDAAGQLTGEGRSSLDHSYRISYEYDPAGNRIRMMKDGVEHLYTYNEANQLLRETFLDGSPVYSVDVVGTVTDENGVQSVTVNGSNATLDGDNFSCRASLSTGPNTLTVTATDVAGNTASQAIRVTYDPSQEIVYSYDNNGNLVSRTAPSGSMTLSYDPENRLKSVVSGGESMSYGYDGDGKRVSYASGQNVVNYFYDGMDVLMERSGSGGPVLTYLRDPYADGGIGGVIQARQGTDPETYYSYDGLGSVAHLSDASGTNVQSYAYDAFGNQLQQTTVSNSRRFLTKETDPSGFIYFGARYYDPSIGRFITQDPMGMVDGPNVYLYCGNDPVNLVDLWGLCLEKKNKGHSVCPRYGNWGGLDWSGGVQIRSGQLGPHVRAIDQMDEYFREHDVCCYRASLIIDHDLSKIYRADCDKTLLESVVSLDQNPSNWQPPAKNVKRAKSYRAKVEWWFGDVLGNRNNA